jgi:hypothetical protein
MSGVLRTENSNPSPNAQFRLPLRHEMGERAGVRWCSGNRGRSFGFPSGNLFWQSLAMVSKRQIENPIAFRTIHCLSAVQSLWQDSRQNAGLKARNVKARAEGPGRFRGFFASPVRAPQIMTPSEPSIPLWPFRSFPSLPSFCPFDTHVITESEKEGTKGQ